MIELLIIPGAMILFLVTWLQAETATRSQTTKLPPPVVLIEPLQPATLLWGFKW